MKSEQKNGESLTRQAEVISEVFEAVVEGVGEWGLGEFKIIPKM